MRAESETQIVHALKAQVGHMAGDLAAVELLLRDSNGCPGAITRLRDVERQAKEIEERVARLEGRMEERDRTTGARMWAILVILLTAGVTTILAALARR